MIEVNVADEIQIGERRLALLQGFEDLYFDRAELNLSLMTDEALVE